MLLGGYIGFLGWAFIYLYPQQNEVGGGILVSSSLVYSTIYYGR